MSDQQYRIYGTHLIKLAHIYTNGQQRYVIDSHTERMYINVNGQPVLQVVVVSLCPLPHIAVGYWVTAQIRDDGEEVLTADQCRVECVIKIPVIQHSRYNQPMNQ
jgi:hypothetical protein